MMMMMMMMMMTTMTRWLLCNICLTFYVMLNGKMMVNDELERMRKEVVMAYSEVLSQHLSGRSEGNHENLQSGQLVFVLKF
jgi:hypothetical protein